MLPSDVFESFVRSVAIVYACRIMRSSSDCQQHRVFDNVVSFVIAFLRPISVLDQAVK